jgi:uncharacterized protein (DUF885 family)
MRTLCLLLAACAALFAMPVVATATAAESPSAVLKRLLADEWERQLRESPESATHSGDTRFDDRWTDLRPEAIAEREAGDRRALAAARAIDRAALSADERLDLDVFTWRIAQAVERQRFREWLEPVSHKGGVQTADDIVEVTRWRTADDFRRYLRRLQTLPALVDQNIALLRAGLAAGQVPPKVLMQRVPAQIRAQVVADPRQSPFWRAFTRWPAGVPAAEREAVEREAATVLREQVVPAYARLLAFFEAEYLPKTRATVAATDRPDGAAYYDFVARESTTTTMSADEIHALGVAEVQRIAAAMEKLKAETGFNGPLPAFFEFLRTDPRFFEKTPAALLQRYQALAKRVDPELVKVFRRIPRLPYGVRAIADNIAPDTTTAYYQLAAPDGSRPGFYYVNLFKPETRPTWEMVPLTLHEAVPGHHAQFARALEMEGVSLFRRTASFTAYAEGWALYAEQLGHEMGLYDDPYDRFGQLAYEQWRAVRLVVDTGLHAKGWTREQAIEYFRRHVPKTDQDIVNEVDRYIAWPGQALAYKIGQLRISALRAKAERTLGAAFDLRDFHDEVLATGSVPLAVLEARLDEWIATRRR